MDADTAGLRGTCGIVRNDNRDVADLGHDGVGLVRGALLIAAGVNMDIGYDSATRPSTVLPEIAQVQSIDLDDAILQSAWIDVVIEDEFLDAARPSVRAEQEGAAFPVAGGSPFELCDSCVPDLRTAEYLRSRPECEADERCH